MKHKNLTRNEAMKAMIDGHKIKRQFTSEGSYAYFSYALNGFYFYIRGRGGKKLDMNFFNLEDGYYIYKETKLKEATRYVPIIRNNPEGLLKNCAVSINKIYNTPEEALAHSDGTIGYRDIKVYLKEERL